MIRGIYRKLGFTLVEILVAVSIIALVAAIGIPNLIRAKHNASETAAITGLKSISVACASFFSAQTPPAYPANLSILGSTVPPYLDNSLTGAVSPATARQGYFYTYNRISSIQFTCTATPAVPGRTGTRVFFVDESGILKLNNASGPPVE